MSDLPALSETETLLRHLPLVLRRRVQDIPQTFFEMDEEELAANTPSGRFTAKETKLRLSFWREFYKAQESNGVLSELAIVRGICSQRHFRERILTDPIKFTYILTPPPDYMLTLEETLGTLMHKLRDVADLPTRDEDGKPIYKNIELMLKVFPHIDNRVKGAAIQRIESKSLSVTTNIKDVPNSMEDIDRRIAELEKSAPQPLIEAPQGARIGVIDISFSEEEGE
jgi:hypothetical protein